MGEALRAAAAEAGIRLTLLDTCYLHGGFDREPDRRAAALRRRRRRRVGGPGRRARRPSPGVSASARPSTRCGPSIPAAMAVVADWAADRAAPLHAHVSEQPAENEQCLAAHGMHPDRAAGHATASSASGSPPCTPPTSTGGDIAALGASGSAVCLCPTTERDLADGIGPTAALAAAGVALCLGSDSHAVVDPFEEARAVELDERLALGPAGHPPPRPPCWPWPPAPGTGASGGPTAGAIAPGAVADLVTVGLDSVRLAGSGRADPVGAVVFAADRRRRPPRGRRRRGGRRRRPARAPRRRRPARAVDRRGVGMSVMTTTVVEGIGQLVTNDERRAAGTRRLGGHRRRPHRRGRHRAGAGRRRADRRRRALRAARASSTATPTSCSPATGPRSSRRGWPASPTRPAGSAPRWRRPGRRPTPSCSPPPQARRAEARRSGITTVEIKSGYGLTAPDEARLLRRRRRPDRRDHLPRRPRRAGRSTRGGRRLRRPGVRRDAGRGGAARPVDRRLLRDRGVRRRPVPGGPRSRAGRRARAAAARQPARARSRGAAGGRAGLRLGRPLHLPHRRRHRRPGRRHRPSPRSCRRPTSRPASPTPTPAACSTPAPASPSPRTATRARATRPRCRSASPSPCARCT